MSKLKYHFLWTIRFLKHSPSYIRDVLLAHFFILIVAIPGLTFLTKFLLSRVDVHYFSLATFPHTLAKQPFLFIAFICLFLTFLLILFFEFSFLLYSMYFITNHRPVSIKQLVVLSSKQIRFLNPAVLVFFLFYVILLSPFSFLVYRSDLLAKVQLPAFILDYIFTNRWLFVISFCLLYLLLLYLGYRFFFVLPELILNKLTVRDAIRESFTLTKHAFLLMLSSFGLLFFLISVVNTLILSIISFFQFYLDYAWPHFALYAAVFFMLCLQITLFFSFILTTFSSFFYMVEIMKRNHRLPILIQVAPISTSLPAISKHLLSLISILTSIVALSYNYTYLTTFSLSNPVTISHRGVSDGQGIQNTIPSLIKTSTSYHPDYVEIDIQETSDHQFIVYHDFTYNHLANSRLVPEKSTLATAEKMVLHENGQTGKIATFDNYLKAAQSLNQKLLIEIKTQQDNPKAMVKRFLEKYESIIEEDHHQVQSLNYNVVEQIKTQAPTIKTGYITPFNLVSPPETKADIIVMEMTSLTAKYVQLVHNSGKELYAWTPNDKSTIERMMLYGVDGVITDRMDYLNQAKNAIRTVSYADKLAFFVLGFG